MFHLPDLPTVGYATERERIGTDQIMTFLRDIERDRLRLLTIVCEGRDKWRRVAREVFGSSMAIDDAALDEMFWYMQLLSARPKGQWALMKARGNALVTKAILRVITPHIEKEREQLKLMRKFA